MDRLEPRFEVVWPWGTNGAFNYQHLWHICIMHGYAYFPVAHRHFVFFQWFRKRNLHVTSISPPSDYITQWVLGLYALSVWVKLSRDSILRYVLRYAAYWRVPLFQSLNYKRCVQFSANYFFGGELYKNSDLWSLKIIWRGIITTYFNGFRNGLSVPPPLFRLSFLTHCIRQGWTNCQTF
jgi:hypothetical protein